MKSQISMIALITAMPVIAQDVVDLKEFTISANYQEIELDRTGASVEVIEDKLKNGSIAVSETLSRTSNLTISTNGPVGAIAYPKLRGADQAQIAVSIDGIDMLDPTGTQSNYDFGSLLTNDIARVEIVKGSQGAIHGASAIGGAISMETPKPSRDGLSFRGHLEYGSYNTISESFGIGNKLDGAIIYFNQSYIKSDGFSASDENDGNEEADGFEGYRISAGAAYEFKNGIEIGFNYIGDKGKGDQDDLGQDGTGLSTHIDGTPDDIFESNSNGARLYTKYDGSNLSSELSYSYYDIKRNYQGTSESLYVPGAIDDTDVTFEGNRKVIEYVGSWTANPELLVSYGFSNKVESYESYGISSGFPSEGIGETTTNSVFGAIDYQMNGDLDLSLAARYEDNDDYASNFSYRIAAAYSPSNNFLMKTSYGTGFRAPSLYELNSPYNVGGLEPETSDSLDISVRYGDESRFLQAALFQIETDNFIDYDGSIDNPKVYGGKGAYTNKNGATIRKGAELSGQYRINDAFTLNGNLAYLETADPNGKPLALRPNLAANIGLTGQIAKKINFSTDLHMEKDRVQYVYNNISGTSDQVKLDDYIVVNARLGYEIGAGEAYINVENLFNEEYQTAYGYGTSDRAFYVGYQLDF